MGGRTVAAHIDDAFVDRLKAIAEGEGRNPSQLVAVATKLLVSLSPAARRALIALDSSTPEEREFAARLIGRAALKARERVIAARNDQTRSPITNQPLDSEEAVEAEALAMSRL
jgi:hypothetical protein